MTVESLKHWFHRLAELHPHDGHAAPSKETLHKIEAALHPYLELSLESFAELLGKVPYPELVHRDNLALMK